MYLKAKWFPPEDFKKLTPEETELAKQIFEKVKALQFGYATADQIGTTLTKELRLVGLDYVEDTLLLKTQYIRSQRDGVRIIENFKILEIEAMVVRSAGTYVLV